MRLSLRLRLLLLVSLVVIAITGGIAAAAVQITSRAVHGYEERRVTMRDRRFAGFLSGAYAQSGDWGAAQQEVERMSQITGDRIVLVGGDGRVVADSAGSLTGHSPEPAWGPPRVPVMHDKAQVGSLFVGPPDPAGGMDALLDSSNRTLVLVAVGAGMGAVLLTLGLARRILGPIESLTSAAGRMSSGDLSQRVSITSGDEIGELGRAFNRMAEGLSHQETLRRNMVADVAHELRTPLTNIRGYLQAMSEGVLQPHPAVIDSLHEEAVSLSSLVDDLQDLSLADAGQLALERQQCDIRAIISQTVLTFASRAADGEIALTWECDADPGLVDVDRRRIAQVLRNLIDNALTYTPAGGTIAVTCGDSLGGHARTPGDWIEVRVADSGAGIPARDLPHVFDRFYRADRSRSRASGGAGLGLAIAKQIVEAHGGQICASSEIGAGTTLRFTLPVARD